MVDVTNYFHQPLSKERTYKNLNIKQITTGKGDYPLY